MQRECVFYCIYFGAIIGSSVNRGQSRSDFVSGCASNVRPLLGQALSR